MFFPLCFLAPSLFSCELLPRLIPMKENVAPLEEKKTGDGNEGLKAMARACWLVPLCFLLLMFFPSARPCCALFRPFVSMIFFPVLPLFLPLYFLSSSLSLSLSLFSLLFFCSSFLSFTSVRLVSTAKRWLLLLWLVHAHGKKGE